jgi:hypothetical protein
MFGFKSKPADPESDFVSALNNLVRDAKKNGVGRRTIRNCLQEHAVSIDRMLDAEIERRKMKC